MSGTPFSKEITVNLGMVCSLSAQGIEKKVQVASIERK